SRVRGSEGVQARDRRAVQEVTPTPSFSFLNPELSLLAFQERVLALAEDAATPLGERLRFLAIVSSNLDEFYMVRMAGLRAAAHDVIPVEEVMRGNLDMLYPHEQLERAWLFRVTRAAELALDEENADDLLDAVAAATQQRPYNPAVRVEVERGMPARLRELIVEDLRREKAPATSP